MKITADRRELSDAVTWVASAIPKRHQVPVLAGIRVEVDAACTEVAISAFDYERSHRAVVKVEVDHPGTALIPGSTLSALLASTKGATVDLDAGDKQVSLTSGRSTYRLGALRLEDYPTLPTLHDPIGSLDADELTAALRALAHAADDANATQEICGVALTVDASAADPVLVLDATNRFAMARVRTAWDGAELPAGLRVPHGALLTAVKGLRGAVDIGADSGSLSVSDAARSVTLRGYDASGGRAPYERFHRDDSDVIAHLDPDELSELLKRASIVVDDKAPVLITVEPGEITVSDFEDGFTDTLEADTSGSARIWLNPRWAAQMLDCCVSSRITLGIQNDERRPVAIHDPDLGAQHVLMPRKPLAAASAA